MKRRQFRLTRQVALYRQASFWLEIAAFIVGAVSLAGLLAALLFLLKS